MVAYGKRTVLLRGADFIVQVENGVAGGAIKPGYLVDGVNTIVAHASAGAACPKAVALERDELGKGIDDSYDNDASVGSPDYATGDSVKVALCHSGVQFTGWIQSGQNITANDRLESAGDGTFRELASGVLLARAIESPGLVLELTKCKMEFM